VINISWKDQFVLLVTRGCVPLTITAAVQHTTEHDAIYVLRKNGKLSHQWPDGNQLAIRKKPPATSVGLNQNMQLNY
jgi:hypothetical protein